MSDWDEIAAPRSSEAGPPSAGGVFLRSAVPGALIAGLVAYAGRTTAAAMILIAATLVGLGAARSDRFRRGLDRSIHAVTKTVGRVLTLGLLGLAEVLIFTPLSLALWALRRDPLGGPTPDPAVWASHPGTVDQPPVARRPFAREPSPPPTRARRIVRFVPRAAGILVLFLALDLGTGWVWQRAVGTPDLAAAPVEERIALATQDAPWFPDYRRELDALRYEFTPFVLTSPHDAAGRYINIEDGVRRSYEPSLAGPGVPTVYFFGGTNVWGEGQRDGHTIPSEIARLAEEDGMAIRVVNFGQRGDVGFGEVLRFEQALAAAAEAPDLVVFADGPDDYAVQREAPSADPSQYGLAEAQAAVVADDRSLWERYSDLSLLQRIAARARAVFSVQPAMAAEGAGGTDDLAADTASVYERGRLLADDIAVEHDVTIRNFWLPIEEAEDTGSAYSRASEALSPQVIDVSDALDDVTEPVYLDGVRTNELGARLVAEAMYRELRPDLEQAATNR